MVLLRACKTLALDTGNTLQVYAVMFSAAASSGTVLLSVPHPSFFWTGLEGRVAMYGRNVNKSRAMTYLPMATGKRN